MQRRTFCVTAIVIALVSTGAAGAAPGIESFDGTNIAFQPRTEFDEVKLSVEGPGGFALDRVFFTGEEIRLDLGDVLNGRYKYTVRIDPIDAAARTQVHRGLFFVRDGAIVSRGAQRAQLNRIRDGLKSETEEAGTRPLRARAHADRGRGPLRADPPARRGSAGGNLIPESPGPNLPAGVDYFGNLGAGSFYVNYQASFYGEAVFDDSVYMNQGASVYGGVDIAHPGGAYVRLNSYYPDPDADGYGYGSDWVVYAGYQGMSFIDLVGFSFPLRIETGTGNIGNVTYNYLPTVYAPLEASLHIEREDGPASVLVRDTGDNARRQMLVIENDGPPEIVLRNTLRPVSWKFGTRNRSIELNRGGSGVSELTLDENGDLEITGTLTQSSSRTLKDSFGPVDVEAILAEVRKLPLSTWKYKVQPDDDRHVGPMAEDFHAAFGLGQSDKQLAPSDAAGVALAAIQGLATQLEQRDEEILLLRRRLDALDAKLEELQAVSGEP